MFFFQIYHLCVWKNKKKRLRNAFQFTPEYSDDNKMNKKTLRKRLLTSFHPFYALKISKSSLVTWI